MLPWEKTSISCGLSHGPHASSATIIMNHTRIVRELGELLRGPPAPLPLASPSPCAVTARECAAGRRGGRGELNCRQQHQLLAWPMGGFLMCNVLVTNTLIVALGVQMWEGASAQEAGRRPGGRLAQAPQSRCSLI